MALFVKFPIALLLSVFVSLPAAAAIGSAVAKVTGYANGAYQSTTAASVSGGSFSAASVINVSGRAVTIPAGMRIASNAASFVGTAARANPTGIGIAVAAWLAGKGIEYINGEWMKSQNDSSVCTSDCFNWTARAPNGLNFTAGTLDSAFGQLASYVSSVYGYTSVQTQEDGYYYANFYTSAGSYVGRSSISYWPRDPDPVTRSPATDQDWSAVQNDSLPDAAAAEAMQKMPVPVQTPTISPYDTPISAPRVDPVTDRPVQDWVRVTPSPTTEDPTKVDTQTYTKDVGLEGTPKATEDKFPDDYNREITQEKIRTSIDEINAEIKASSAPDPSDWSKSVTDKTKEINDEIKAKADDLPNQYVTDKDLFFSWVWTPPVGTCQPIAAGSIRGASFSGWDLCPTVNVVRNAMAYLFAIFSAILVYGQLFRSSDS